MIQVFLLSIRLLLAGLIVAVPFAVIGGAAAGVAGVVAGATLAAIILTIAAFSCERVVVSALRAQAGDPPGLFATLQRALDETVTRSHLARGGRTPRLLVFPDPAPQAIVIRSFGSRGSILLSQGLISILSESQLRLVLHSSILRSRQPGLLVGGICGVLAHRFIGLVPTAWIETAYRTRRPTAPIRLGVFSMARFLIVLPFVRLLHRLGRPRDWTLPDLPGLADNALRNYRLVGAAYPQVGFSHLYLKTDWNRSF